MNLDNQTILVLILPLALLLFGVAGYHIIEGWPILDCVYMTVITVATVGFSEIHELSQTGRVFTVVLILTGVMIIAYSIQWFVMYMLQKNIFGTLGRRRMDRKIKTLKDHTIVCGYGKIGRHVADTFLAEGEPFVIIDREFPDEEHMAEKGLMYIEGDGADEVVLEEAGIDRARTLVAVVGSDADNLFITMTARGLNREIKVVARAEDANNKGKLLRAGANKVVLPYEMGGRRIAAQVMFPSVTDFLETVMSSENLELRMAELKVGGSSSLNNQSLHESHIRRETGCIILAIKPDGKKLITNPDSEMKINAGDMLICLGTMEQIQELQKLAEVP